jgi:two-component system response regulator YesN
MYSPIGRLFEVTKEINKEYGEAQERDEFSYIEERFRTIFSRGNQLQQQVKGHFTQLREFIIMKLFMGQISESEFMEKSGMYGFPQGWGKLGVLSLQIDTLQDTRYRESDRDLLLFAINNIVGELVPQSSLFIPVVMDESQVTLLISRETDVNLCKEELYRTAELVQAKVYEYLKLRVSVGISRPFDSIVDAKTAYRESLEVLKRRISLGNEIIMHADDVRNEGRAASVLHEKLKALEDQLVHEVKAGENDKVNLIFSEYVSLIGETGMDHSVLQLYLVQLISRIMQLVQEQGISVQAVIGEKGTVERFMKLRTLDEINQWFRSSMFEPVIASLARRTENQYVSIANQMLEIIHNKYDQELSLESCAAELNFHPVYLSRVFKKEVGVTFSEYLTDYRMTKAKTWLETTNMKVSEIATKLSYANATAFIRMFRKIVGMTPGEYRSFHSKFE